MAQPSLLPWQNDIIGHTPIYGPEQGDGGPSLQAIEKRAYNYSDQVVSDSNSVRVNLYSGSAYPVRPSAQVVMWIGPVEPPTSGAGSATGNDLWIPTA